MNVKWKRVEDFLVVIKKINFVKFKFKVLVVFKLKLLFKVIVKKFIVVMKVVKRCVVEKMKNGKWFINFKVEEYKVKVEN